MIFQDHDTLTIVALVVMVVSAIAMIICVLMLQRSLLSDRFLRIQIVKFINDVTVESSSDADRKRSSFIKRRARRLRPVRTVMHAGRSRG